MKTVKGFHIEENSKPWPYLTGLATGLFAAWLLFFPTFRSFFSPPEELEYTWGYLLTFTLCLITGVVINHYLQDTHKVNPNRKGVNLYLSAAFQGILTIMITYLDLTPGLVLFLFMLLGINSAHLLLYYLCFFYRQANPLIFLYNLIISLALLSNLFYYLSLFPRALPVLKTASCFMGSTPLLTVSLFPSLRQAGVRHTASPRLPLMETQGFCPVNIKPGAEITADTKTLPKKNEEIEGIRARPVEEPVEEGGGERGEKGEVEMEKVNKSDTAGRAGGRFAGEVGESLIQSGPVPGAVEGITGLRGTQGLGISTPGKGQHIEKSRGITGGGLAVGIPAGPEGSLPPGPGPPGDTPAPLSPADLKGLSHQFRLTPTEKKVFSLLCQEFNNKDIAKELFVSVNTIKFHVRNILKKAGAKNRQELKGLIQKTLSGL